MKHNVEVMYSLGAGSQHVRDEVRRSRQIEQNRKIGSELDEPCEPTVMSLHKMVQGLVLIESTGAIVNRETMRVRKRSAAFDTYAASTSRIESASGTKIVPTLDLWLREAQRKSVDVLTWWPGKPEFCQPPEGSDAGNRAFNMWRGFNPFPRPDGDIETLVKPFLDHVVYLVPVQEEQRRFIQWLAHTLQKPGELPQTAYLMIAETTGIGRNWLASVLTRVLRGYVAAGVSISEVLEGSFNGRLSQKLLATVDEVREGTSPQRHRKGQRLKALITEEFRLINEKYGLQSVQKNCCRWLMFSNHWDALPFDNADRRIVVIENPGVRQSAAYYEKIYGLLDDPRFIAAVQHFLLTLDISDFKAGEHAPRNAAKDKALGSMESPIDGAVKEFAKAWPGDLATSRDLRSFVLQMVGGAAPNDQTLKYAIERAGMILPNKRIKLGGNADSVLIVRNWTREQVKDEKPPTLVKLILEARQQFADCDGIARTADGP